jgi:hypothetical protein
MQDCALHIAEQPKETFPTLTWEMIALTGAIQSGVSLLIFCFSDTRLAFIGGRSGYLLDLLIVGLLISLIGIVGWATRPAGRLRFIRTGIVFVYPWAAILTAFAIVPSDHLSHLGLGSSVLLSWCLLAFALFMSRRIHCVNGRRREGA